jgi:hypothetical protein
MHVDLINRAKNLAKERSPITKSLKALVQERMTSSLREESFVSCLTALAQVVLPENPGDWPSSEETQVWTVEDLAMRVQSRSKTPIKLDRWFNEAETALHAFKEFSLKNWTIEGASTSDTRRIEALLKTRMELLQQCVDPFYCDFPQIVDKGARSKLKTLSNNMFKLLVPGRNPSSKEIVIQRSSRRVSDRE